MTGTPEQLATRVLAYVIAHPERLAAFSDATGLRLSDLRHERKRRPFHLALLDFVLTNEADLAAFLASHETSRADIASAREQFAGSNPATSSIEALRETVDELESIARSLKATQRRSRFRIVN